MSRVAVLDIGKTNVKLSAADRDGTILETLSTPNRVHPGPPYRHHDVEGLEAWAVAALADAYAPRIAAFRRLYAALRPEFAR